MKLAARVTNLEASIGMKKDSKDPFHVLLKHTKLDEDDKEDIPESDAAKVIDLDKQLCDGVRVLRGHVVGSSSPWEISLGNLTRISVTGAGIIWTIMILEISYSSNPCWSSTPGVELVALQLLKQLQKATDNNMYGMLEAHVASSFQQILAPGFGSDTGTVLSLPEVGGSGQNWGTPEAVGGPCSLGE